MRRLSCSLSRSVTSACCAATSERCASSRSSCVVLPARYWVSARRSCRSEDASSDCCSGYLCSNGACTDVPPIPNYGASATFKRDFSNTCVQGYRPKWGTFEYQGSYPAGSNMVVNVRVADDAASLATATPLVNVGTANASTNGWTYLPMSGFSVDSLLTSAGAPLTAKLLRVEITLNPSSDATVCGAPGGL